MRNKICLLIALVLMMACMATTVSAAPTASTYYIKASKSNCTVTVYSKNKNGQYADVVKTFKAGMGKTDASTPNGKFSILSKEEWHSFSNNYNAKFASKFADGLYIYSNLYEGKNTAKPVASSVAQIGQRATSGCLISDLSSAQWIYNNCPVGTVIEIVK